MAFNAAEIRHELHKKPELSKKEVETAKFIVGVLESIGNCSITSSIGGTGILATISGAEDGPTSIFRAELDALPITESNSHDHVSQNIGRMHACGHDGHMTCLLSLANELKLSPPKRGKVILLFQPAEEIGEGAIAMVEDSSNILNDIHPQFIFGFHNIPGYTKGQILVREGTFACASTGVEISIIGKPSHAAYPENGVSPDITIAEFLLALKEIPNHYPDYLAMSTVCYINAGEEAYGTAAGQAKMCITLRSDNQDVFVSMKQHVQNTISEITKKHNLDFQLKWIEPFSATVNSVDGVSKIKTAANEFGYSIKELEEPMRWSEDFGIFTEKWHGAFFGIGSGIDSPQLHNNDFDFPDDIIPIATNVYTSLVNQIHN